MPEEKTGNDQEKDQKNNSPEGKQDNQKPEEKEEKKPEEKGNEEDAIPKSRFEKLYNDKKESDRRLEELEKEKAEREEKKLLEEKRYDEILEKKNTEIAELKEKASRVDASDSALQALLDTEVEQIPEEKRGMIPEYPVAKKLEWIAKNKAFLIGTAQSKDKPPANTGGDQPKNEGGDNLDELEVIQNQLKELREKKINNGFLSHQDQQKVSSLTIKKRKLIEEQS